MKKILKKIFLKKDWNGLSVIGAMLFISGFETSEYILMLFGFIIGLVGLYNLKD